MVRSKRVKGAGSAPTGVAGMPDAPASRLLTPTGCRSRTATMRLAAARPRAGSVGTGRAGRWAGHAAVAARRGRSRSGIKAERGERRPDKAAAESRNLGDRLHSLAAPGWTGRDAEWLALVCLHGLGGVFLRRQHLAFLGQSHLELARRFVRRCGKAAVEERWNASGLKVCRIVDRALYRFEWRRTLMDDWAAYLEPECRRHAAPRR